MIRVMNEADCESKQQRKDVNLQTGHLSATFIFAAYDRCILPVDVHGLHETCTRSQRESAAPASSAEHGGREKLSDAKFIAWAYRDMFRAARQPCGPGRWSNLVKERLTESNILHNWNTDTDTVW